jgi:hypothetical protein
MLYFDDDDIYLFFCYVTFCSSSVIENDVNGSALSSQISDIISSLRWDLSLSREEVAFVGTICK